MDKKQPVLGYTLLEVIVGLLLLGWLGAIAFGSWLSFWQRQQVRVAAAQLLQALYQAKSEAAKQSVRYAVTVCSNLPDVPTSKGIKYSVHPYSQPPLLFTTIESVDLVKSTVRRSPTRYDLERRKYGDCYTTYLGLFPGDGYALGFFYLSNSQQSYGYRVGFNTLIGNRVSCPVRSWENPRCWRN